MLALASRAAALNLSREPRRPREGVHTSDDTDVITPRLIALGMITENSAALDSTLRGMFCALVGSKYAAVVAAGRDAGWLIDY
jgi:hypothetical protein